MSWVILVAILVIVAFFKLGGYQLAIRVFSGWGDGPSKEALDEFEEAELREDSG